MAQRAWGDQTFLVTNAAVASNGANARVGGFVPSTVYGGRIRSMTWIPEGADNSAASAVTYRQLAIYNGGTSGSGTATAMRLASINLTATVASYGKAAGTVVYSATGASAASGTFAAGEVLYLNQITVGGTDATHSVLAAGRFEIEIEFIG